MIKEWFKHLSCSFELNIDIIVDRESVCEMQSFTLNELFSS